MKVGIYTREGEPLGQAFTEGAKLVGWRTMQRSANDFHQGDTEDFDLVFLYSLRTRHADLILESYRNRRPQVPVVVMDYGYLKRVCQEQFGGGGDYWQVSIDRLNSVPSFECPPDRFEALELPVVERGGQPNGYVLVCGQHEGDPSHGRQTAAQLQAWANAQVASWSEDGAVVVFRAHPFSPHILPTEPCVVDMGKSTKESLAGAALVVCQASNIGHEALLAGIPVLATSERAPYRELSGTKLPSVEARRAYFNRLAYAQWTIEEVAAGLWHEFCLQKIIEV